MEFPHEFKFVVLVSRLLLSAVQICCSSVFRFPRMFRFVSLESFLRGSVCKARLLTAPGSAVAVAVWPPDNLRRTVSLGVASEHKSQFHCLQPISSQTRKDMLEFPGLS